MNHWVELCCLGAALFIASNLWFYYRVMRPLEELSKQATELTKGDFESFDDSCGGISEIDSLRRAMSGMVGHVRRAQEQHRGYTERLMNGQEHERKRIARELHDDTVQSFVAIAQGIDLVNNWLTNDLGRAKLLLQSVRDQSIQAMTSLRELIGDLRPPALDEFGLVAALKMQLGRISDLQVNLFIEGKERRLSEIYELTLFRVVQEALSNVCRHSHATEASIYVCYFKDHVSVTVQDSGRGFFLPGSFNDFAVSGHYGLLGIQERVEHLNGSFYVKSHPDTGTTLTVSLPLEIPQQPGGTERDPVCSAVLQPEQAYGSVEYQGKRYYFCCPVCQGAFQKEPAIYLSELTIS